ncbi:MAG: RagB/SusD family nutrient uptake outer membrane protein [Hymenobacter sp.]
MKKHVFLLLTAGLLGALGGCEKDLDQTPLSNGSVPSFYKTAADFDQALTAVYSQLRGYPNRILTTSEVRSDNLYGVSQQGVRDWDPINNFATTLSISPYISDTWTSDFAAIFRANTFLDQLAQNGTVTGALRPRYEAEARFLRAFHYLDLVRTFGKVPVLDKPLLPAQVSAVPRSPVSAVYDLIIADLTAAKATLPTAYTGINVGRATAGAAKGLLALVYLTRSGPSYGIEGPGQDSNEYGKALALLNEVIASNAYSLLPSYPAIFSYTNENNAEVVFDIQYIVGLGSSFPGLLVPDGYFTSLGIPFVSGGIELKPVSTNLLNSFAANDTRKAFSIQTGYTNAGIAETRSLVKKYISAAGRGTAYTDWPINFIVMRYADILLMKAEAILKGGGGTPAEALAIVNQVRARGAQPALTSLTYPQLIEERRREFIGEGLRWPDLVRSGQALTVMNAWIPVEDAGPSPKIRRNIGPNDLLYPVPQAELSASPGLYSQNPGY